MSHVYQPLNVNLVIDNSVLVSELSLHEKLESLIHSLNQTITESLYRDALNLAVYSFDNLSVKVIKDFTDSTIQPLPQNGFPLMNQMLEKITSNTERFIESTYDPTHTPYHRPWLVIMSSGLGYDKIDFFETYHAKTPASQPVLFPFLISKKILMYDLSKINQVKPFIPLKDNNIEEFGQWLKMMIHTRMTIPPSEGMKLQKSMFEGWTEL